MPYIALSEKDGSIRKAITHKNRQPERRKRARAVISGRGALKELGLKKASARSLAANPAPAHSLVRWGPKRACRLTRLDLTTVYWARLAEGLKVFVKVPMISSFAPAILALFVFLRVLCG